MALSFRQFGTAETLDETMGASGEYLDCASGPDFSIRMHLDAVDGIARDVIEGVKSLPRRGVEIGGLLLGSSRPGRRTEIVVDRYQRLPCNHRFGPQFSLDESELEGLERAATSLAASDELSVLGFYRSNTRTRFQPEASDLEIAARYFRDAGDLMLLILPVDSRDIRAQFFVREESGDFSPAGDEFSFRGRVLGPMGTLVEFDPVPVEASSRQAAVPPPLAPAAPPVHIPVQPKEVEPRLEVAVPPAPPEPVSIERPRRLVPDFVPVEAQRPLPWPDMPPSRSEELTDEATRATRTNESPGFLKRWWPLGGALLLVGGGLAFLFMQPERAGRKEAPPAAPAVESTGVVRPLGLYVDPTGDTWRISWNSAASALQGARNVALFVREGDDQNRIDLAPQDLESGTYQYQPKTDRGAARDVTFRIEVTDASSHVSAESFRLMRNTQTAAAAAPAPSVQAPPAAEAPAAKPAATAHPRAIRKVPPVVPASIRPRIRGSIPLDVLVKIDARGRVISAAPVRKAHNSLELFLGQRAVAAARQWRFEPTEGSEVIHFIFER